MINKLKGASRHKYRSNFHMKTIKIKWRQIKSNKGREYSLYPTLKMPLVLSITEEHYRKELIDLISKLHNIVKNSKDTIYFDFKRTKKIYAQAMLLLYAEINNLKNLNSYIQFKCHVPINSKVSHVLNQIGLYALCNMQFSAKFEYDDVVYWRKCSGTGVIGEKFDKIVDNIKDVFNSNIDLYGGCVEATKNARRHAYIEKRNVSDVATNIAEWWIFSQIKDGELSVNVCDLGIGIPRTLPIQRKRLVKKLLSLGKTSDSDLIEGAIDAPTSRSGETFRGNGLPKIANIARNQKGALLAIYSNCGYVKMSNKDSFKYDYRDAIPGTIISWTLPLEERHDRNN